MSIWPDISEQAVLNLQDTIASETVLLRKAILKLLEIKDSDIRILNFEQSRDAVDKGLHSGGAASAVIPLVALFYGGFIDIDVTDPTRRGQVGRRTCPSDSRDVTRSGLATPSGDPGAAAVPPSRCGAVRRR